VNASVVDMTCRSVTPAAYDGIDTTVRVAWNGQMKGINGYTEGDVVSTDTIGEPCTCVFDAETGIALYDHFLKLGTWWV
jgi:glyceraldehyde 3-phosphate dehydrogenase